MNAQIQKLTRQLFAARLNKELARFTKLDEYAVRLANAAAEEYINYVVRYNQCQSKAQQIDNLRYELRSHAVA